VYDPVQDSSDLVILDASDFAAPPLARIRMPRRVPYGFHGNWIPNA
jgi:carotenoid cleavage dioxygenase-like enzyme